MQTFLHELEAIVAKSYQEVILPQIQERSPELVKQGLDKLREVARHRAKVAVLAEIDITWMEEPYREELLERVREQVPVDVQVFLNVNGDKINFQPGKYCAGDANGKLQYDFPCWGRHGVGVRHNLKHLKSKNKQRNETPIFEMILRMFGCLEGDIDRKPGDFSLPFAVEILDRVLTWAMEDVATAGSLSHEDYKKLFAGMAAGAGNISQMKSVEDAYVGLLSPK